MKPAAVLLSRLQAHTWAHVPTAELLSWGFDPATLTAAVIALADAGLVDLAHDDRPRPENTQQLIPDGERWVCAVAVRN